MPRRKILYLEPCAVCGAEPAALHYGAVVCEPCKMFFMRGVRKEIWQPCKNPDNCTDILACPDCRFAKCVTIGMQQQEVGLQSRHRYKLSNEKLCPPLRIYITSYEKPFLKLVNSNREVDATSLAILLQQLEKFCDADSSHLDYQFEYDQDMTLHDAFSNPTQLCQRVPMGFGDPHPYSFYSTTNDQIISRVSVRTTLHSIDWCNGCTELNELDTADKLALCRQQFTIIDYLTRTYNIYKYNWHGLLHAFGGRVEKFPQANQSLREFIIRIETVARRDVIAVMKELEMTVEEYVFLKKIVFYGSPCVINEKTTIFANFQRRKHEMALLKFLQKTYTHVEAKSRLLKLLSLRRPLQRMVFYTESNRAMFMLFNTYGARSRLREDLFARC